MAKPQHKPTEKSITEAMAYAAVGVPHHDIAKLIGVSIKTLLKHYRKEMDIGKARANATVARGLFQSATSGNLGAQIFWLKSQAGWRETQRPQAKARVSTYVSKKREAESASMTAQKGSPWEGLIHGTIRTGLNG